MLSRSTAMVRETFVQRHTPFELAKKAAHRTNRLRKKLPAKRCSNVKWTTAILERAIALDKDDVALAISRFVNRSPTELRARMDQWEKPILQAPIPGKAKCVPTEETLRAVKRAVLEFFDREEAMGSRSHVVKAFSLVSGERLRFDWAGAKGRVSRASFDYKKKIDKWINAIAMSYGDTNALCEIYACGTKKVTARALAAIICHEALHNMALRTRPGNPFLSEDKEHMAMALMGDPQLVDPLWLH